jgi:type IV pilus secretin PilQ/predicted competence protein
VLVAQLRAPIVAQAAGAQQRPRLISLDFKDADINNILRILAEFSGLNIVTSDDVKGKVTVRLQNVPWQQALDSVVRAAKLAYVQEGNIIRVDKLENLTKEAEAAFRAEQREVEISQRRKEADLRLAEQERAAALARQEFEVKRQQLEGLLAPTVEEVVRLRYGHVGIKRVQTIDFFTDVVSTQEEKGIEEAITGGIKKEEGKSAGMLSPRGSLTVDQRTNSLIVRDVPDNLAKIKEFIEKVDRPTPSIQIEARLVEMSRQDARSLGVIWGGLWTPRNSGNGPVVDLRGAPPGGPVSGDVAGAATPTTAANFPASLGTIGGLLAGSTPFGLGLGWLASNFALDIQLQALEGQKRARNLSSPSLMTVDNQPATVASGQKFPIISVTVGHLHRRDDPAPGHAAGGRRRPHPDDDRGEGRRVPQLRVRRRPHRADRQHAEHDHAGGDRRRRHRRDRGPSPGAVQQRRARGSVAFEDPGPRLAVQERSDRDRASGAGRVPHRQGRRHPGAGGSRAARPADGARSSRRPRSPGPAGPERPGAGDDAGCGLVRRADSGRRARRDTRRPGDAGRDAGDDVGGAAGGPDSGPSGHGRGAVDDDVVAPETRGRPGGGTRRPRGNGLDGGRAGVPDPLPRAHGAGQGLLLLRGAAVDLLPG